MNSCSNHGVCHTGECYCDPEYEGKDCSLKKKCTDNCNNNGVCKYGKCFCNPGYQGLACLPIKKLEKKCEDTCEGFCFSGKCYCPNENDEKLIFSKESKFNFLEETSECPLKCSNKGKCIGNKCYCEQG